MLADLARMSECVSRMPALFGRQDEMVDQYIRSAGTQPVLALPDEETGDPEHPGSVAFGMRTFGRAQNGAEEPARVAESLTRAMRRLVHDPQDPAGAGTATRCERSWRASGAIDGTDAVLLRFSPKVDDGGSLSSIFGTVPLTSDHDRPSPADRAPGVRDLTTGAEASAACPPNRA